MASPFTLDDGSDSDAGSGLDTHRSMGNRSNKSNKSKSNNDPNHYGSSGNRGVLGDTEVNIDTQWGDLPDEDPTAHTMQAAFNNEMAHGRGWDDSYDEAAASGSYLESHFLDSRSGSPGPRVQVVDSDRETDDEDRNNLIDGKRIDKKNRKKSKGKERRSRGKAPAIQIDGENGGSGTGNSYSATADSASPPLFEEVDVNMNMNNAHGNGNKIGQSKNRNGGINVTNEGNTSDNTQGNGNADEGRPSCDAPPMELAEGASTLYYPLPPPTDGVSIFDIEGKPEVTADTNGKIYEELEPPSYADVTAEDAPSYYNTTIVSTGFAEDGEILVEGMPVGDFFTFFVNMLVSMTFDFIGFFLTTLLATSHAAKCGSKSGLGITLIRYGFSMRSFSFGGGSGPNDPFGNSTAPIENPGYVNDDPNFDGDFESRKQMILEQNEIVSYILMFCGFILLVISQAAFIKAKRMEVAIAATVAQGIEATV